MPRANVGGVNDVGGGPEEWFMSLPIVTRCWFGGTLLTTCAANFNMFSVYKIIWSFESIKDNFEIWRVLTPFMYAGPFSINSLFLMYMVYQFSKQYESGGPYNTGAGGGTADYVFMMMLGILLLLVSFVLLGGMIPLPPIFTQNLVFYVLYIWSKRNPTNAANIWGFQMKAYQLPFAYLAINVLMGNPYWGLIHGMACGHVYYFCVDVVPLVYGKDFLHTPQFLIDYFGIGEYHPQNGGNNGAGVAEGIAAPGRVAPPNDPAARGGEGGRGGHNWGGGGNVLGTR